MEGAQLCERPAWEKVRPWVKKRLSRQLQGGRVK